MDNGCGYSYQQQQEEDEQKWIEYRFKPYTKEELELIEYQKKQFGLIKTIFDSEE